MPVKALSTKTLDIAPIKPTDSVFQELDKAASVNMGLPEVFSIPEKPEFALMTFNNLKDPNKNNAPRQGIGVEIHLPDNSTKVITVSSLSRKYFDESVDVGDTSGKHQRAAIDVFQDVNTMQLTPSEQIALLAGKTIEKAGEETVWIGKFKDGQVVGYDETKKAVYTVK